MTTYSTFICNWLVELLMTKCRPIVIAPANTGKESNNKKAVIKTAHTNRGKL